MEEIEKEKCVIPRDGEGKIIPMETTLETLPDKPRVKIIPLTKGEFQEIVNTPDKEDELIRTHLISPSFTEDEFKYIKPVMYGAFKMAILSLTTDVSQKEIQSSTNKVLLDSIEAKKKFIKTSND